MTASTAIVEVRRAWWLDMYLWGVITVALLMGGEPDMEKVMRVIVRGLRWRFVGARRWNTF